MAHFASFDPNLNLRFTTLMDFPPLSNILDTIQRLLKISGSVNVRTFLPGKPSGNPFVYGLENEKDILASLTNFANDGFFTILNETISVTDGGVSGVVDKDIVEFGPDDTPRAVEKPGVCSLPYEIAKNILSKVYGIAEPIPRKPHSRIEFSIHPIRVGSRHEQVVVWESSPSRMGQKYNPQINWPNSFSRHIGDKVFGLMIADALGLPVPFGTVVGRRVSPFSFGTRTHTNETWIRTSPTTQQPGKFTTTSRWQDPFALMQSEDPDGTSIQSIFFQESVDPKFSGASLPLDSTSLIEGVHGSGDSFMLGEILPISLPSEVIEDVKQIISTAEELLKSRIRIEWVHDGVAVWVVQLHKVSRLGAVEPVAVADAVKTWVDYDPAQGLEFLIMLMRSLDKESDGIQITKLIGVTSHVGDLLRKEGFRFRFMKS